MQLFVLNENEFKVEFLKLEIILLNCNALYAFVKKWFYKCGKINAK